MTAIISHQCCHEKCAVQPKTDAPLNLTGKTVIYVP